MLKELHDAFCHDGLLGKMDSLVDSFDDYKKGKERKEIAALRAAIEDQDARRKGKRAFWLMVIGFFLGNEAFWAFAVPMIKDWLSGGGG